MAFFSLDVTYCLSITPRIHILPVIPYKTHALEPKKILTLTIFSYPMFTPRNRNYGFISQYGPS